MSLSTAAEPVPFVIDEHGVARVGGTRLTLAVLLEAYLGGAAPDELAADFPHVPQSEIFSAVAYYLRHTSEVNAYLAADRDRAAAVQEKIERDFPPNRIRQRLAEARESGRHAEPAG